MGTYKDAKGWKLIFQDHKGMRRTLRVAELNRRELDFVGRHIERLVGARVSRADVAPDTLAWLATIDDKLRTRLEALDLCDPLANRGKPKLKPFLDDYIASQRVKSRTQINNSAAARCLIKFFGADRRIDTITAGDAEQFSWWLRKPAQEGGRNLGDNTSRRHCGRAKQFFEHAVNCEYLPRNPFANPRIPTRVQPSHAEREHFISREELQLLLDECPNTEWRLMLTLARIGGLRIPSESASLRWGDVDWTPEKGTIRVTSPKTAQHVGHGMRVVPLFPELRAALNEAWELGDKKSEFIFTKLQGPGINLRTQLHRIMRRAGVPEFPKPFHNMRASRAIELSRDWPAHVVQTWLGHSAAVAQKHYLRVQPEDIGRANVVATRVATAGADLGGFERIPETGEAARNCEKTGFLVNSSRLPVPPLGLEPRT